MIFLLPLLSYSTLICINYCNGSCPNISDYIIYNQTEYDELVQIINGPFIFYLCNSRLEPFYLDLSIIEYTDIQVFGQNQSSYLAIDKFGDHSDISLNNLILNISNSIIDMNCSKLSLISCSIDVNNPIPPINVVFLTIDYSLLDLALSINASSLSLTNFYPLNKSKSLVFDHPMQINFGSIGIPCSLSVHDQFVSFSFENGAIFSIFSNTTTSKANTYYFQHKNNVNISLFNGSQKYMKTKMYLMATNNVTFFSEGMYTVPISNLTIFGNIFIESSFGPQYLLVYGNLVLNKDSVVIPNFLMAEYFITDITSGRNVPTECFITICEYSPNSHINSNDPFLKIKIANLKGNAQSGSKGVATFTTQNHILIMSKLVISHISLKFRYLEFSPVSTGIVIDFSYLEFNDLQPIYATEVIGSDIKVVSLVQNINIVELIDYYLFNRTIKSLDLLNFSRKLVKSFIIDYDPNSVIDGFSRDSSILFLVEKENIITLSFSDLPGNFVQSICIDISLTNSLCQYQKLRKYDLQHFSQWNSTVSRNTKKVSLMIVKRIENVTFNFDSLPKDCELEISTVSSLGSSISIIASTHFLTQLDSISFSSVQVFFVSSEQELCFKCKNIHFMKKVSFDENQVSHFDFSQVKNLYISFELIGSLPYHTNPSPIIYTSKGFNRVHYIDDGWDFYNSNQKVLHFIPSNSFLKYRVFFDDIEGIISPIVITASIQKEASRIIPLEMIGPLVMNIKGDWSQISSFPAVLVQAGKYLTTEIEQSFYPLQLTSECMYKSLTITNHSAIFRYPFSPTSNSYYPVFHMEEGKSITILNYSGIIDGGISCYGHLNIVDCLLSESTVTKFTNANINNSLTLNPNSTLFLHNGAVSNTTIILKSSYTTGFPKIEMFNTVFSPHSVIVFVEGSNARPPPHPIRLICGQIPNTTFVDIKAKDISYRYDDDCILLEFHYSSESKSSFSLSKIIVGSLCLIFMLALLYCVFRRKPETEESNTTVGLNLI